MRRIAHALEAQLCTALERAFPDEVAAAQQAGTPSIRSWRRPASRNSVISRPTELWPWLGV